MQIVRVGNGFAAIRSLDDQSGFLGVHLNVDASVAQCIVEHQERFIQ
jgi:hypothetical protein